MTMKRCNDYGLKCLKCPHWNHWTNFCTKWKITTSTSGDGMTEKRYSLGKIGCYRTKLIVDNETKHEIGNSVVVKRLNVLHEENEQLKLFKEKVFDLIDKKINKLKNTNEVLLIPRKSVEILKELKKELEE